MKSLDSNQMRLQNKLGLVVTIEGGNALLREIIYNWAITFLNSQLLINLFFLSMQSSSKFIIGMEQSSENGFKENKGNIL